MRREIFKSAKMQWKMLLSIVVVGALVENSAFVEGISCYKCSNCVNLAEYVDTVDTEPCETSCAIWRSRNHVMSSCGQKNIISFNFRRFR